MGNTLPHLWQEGIVACKRTSHTHNNKNPNPNGATWPPERPAYRQASLGLLLDNNNYNNNNQNNQEYHEIVWSLGVTSFSWFDTRSSCKRPSGCWNTIGDELTTNLWGECICQMDERYAHMQQHPLARISHLASLQPNLCPRISLKD